MRRSTAVGRRGTLWALWVVGVLLCCGHGRFCTAQTGPPRVFQQVKGDLWRAGNGNWWSLIYVTPGGLVLVDPISTDFATWLKAELQTRFPGKAVRYIVYSHS